ncbi:MAG: hypothetical protein U0835_18135 [Isosphaeraceae bacterium]
MLTPSWKVWIAFIASSNRARSRAFAARSFRFAWALYGQDAGQPDEPRPAPSAAAAVTVVRRRRIQRRARSENGSR